MTTRGTTNTAVRAMTCSIDDCEKPALSRGWCQAHYFRWRRHGDPEGSAPTRWEDLRGQRFGSLEVVEQTSGRSCLCRCDCGALTKARPSALRRGTHLTCGSRAAHYRRADAGYQAAHDRVKRDRGPASTYACADCGVPAQHWCYDRDDPDELYAVGLSAQPVPYSLDPARYTPRCVSCHKYFDLAHIGTPRHKRGCLHCQFVAEYRLARHAYELRREAITGAYASEEAEYDEQHEAPTYKAWLIAGRGRNEEPA